MIILTDVENQLGWIPGGTGVQYQRNRSLAHHIVTKALARHGYTEDDLFLAVAYCKNTRTPVDHPLQLLRYVPTARNTAPARTQASDLDTQVRDAIDLEAGRTIADGNIAGYWIGRLSRSLGPARADTLTEWREAGRG